MFMYNLVSKILSLILTQLQINLLEKSRNFIRILIGFIQHFNSKSQTRANIYFRDFANREIKYFMQKY